MRTAFALAFLVVLYLSLVFETGVFYHATQRVLDWLNQPQGSGYMGWYIMLSLGAGFLFKITYFDTLKLNRVTRQLLERIKTHGATAEKMENSGYGNVRLRANIIFQDSGFLFTIKQTTGNTDNDVLFSRKFLDWNSLQQFIARETSFNLHDFMHGIEPQNGV
ncbi:MAG: hypothetical protein OEZ68_07715 [Gammaproteobacteria bacterium]|nr:hypothetical protein [Gammaproteobacteria bacterium]MDH5800672.1 hypothetical protein [Gammaproteobacteria bacterium]